LRQAPDRHVLRRGSLPSVRVLRGFDFGALRCLYEAHNREIATGRFIADGEAMSLLGPPGVD